MGQYPTQRAVDKVAVNKYQRIQLDHVDAVEQEGSTAVMVNHSVLALAPVAQEYVASAETMQLADCCK